ncbi:LLM class flavin-dependent oxidoreductase [Flavitalea sp. BT771]|uniref:MupA/Atu3671 family FMN-dependent luciferase-like monooxygenase n=1 Tax=Flavitalea sp. BT771 TaxID=3063329 RepID=UPI0026E26597|nr:MupA/Atu3671 family FMN-dependent luciferase-like monooxygenase [Flavitalea sp. BT771]MDO6434615.1 LLM class flavin-dependent oxidoreductase [Flavitalea sp. BT771]MDV6223515.1 LLM class flavin-dependent oxidoreductase [Flavitalea sp. BT771]
MNKKVIHTVFEEVVRRYPHKLAIEEESSGITYDQLNIYANQMSHLLVSLGCGKDSIVQVFIPSSIRMVGCLLAVLKAAAVFLPVDINFSERRLRQVFQNTFHGIVVVAEESLDTLVAIAARLDIRIDHLIVVTPGREISHYVLYNGVPEAAPLSMPDAWSGDPVSDADGDTSNYIYYTSGSTGEGKAIEGCNVSLSHFIHWEIKEFSIEASCRVSQLTQATFDASLRDIFVPLITGGTLCIPPPQAKEDPAALLQWLETAKISLVHCVPSLFRVMTRELQTNETRRYDLGNLTYMIMAGELLYARDIIEWRKAMGDGINLVNFYGATETTLIKTFYRIGTVPEDPSYVIPVGIPIGNTTVAIIRDGRLCKVNEPGEIYLKTPFTTKGYYKDRQLTDTCFVQNPLQKDEKDIVYRSGDTGRLLPDGNIQVMGRLDNQVKINGIRVEPGEIEKALLRMANITGAVVKAHRGEDNLLALVAYYTGEKKEVEELRSALSTELNLPVIPSYFIHLHEFPLNMNGKIDRNALPAPRLAVADHPAFEPPQGDMETVLGSFWKEILGLEKVDRNTSFFNVGGHSLRAIQLVSRIHRSLGVSLKIADIFTQRTVRDLARLISGKIKSGYLSINPAPQEEGYPLSSAQRRLWVLGQFDQGSVAYNMPGKYVFEGSLDRDALDYAFEAVVRRHESLRTVFRIDTNGEVRQYIRCPEDAAFTISFRDLTGEDEPEKELEKDLHASVTRPFDLAAGPLGRAALFRLNEHKWVFTYTLHHIISDGWSVSVLMNELIACYNARKKGSDPSLPPLRIQYKDYAVWQQEQLGGEALKAHKAYWLGQLDGELPVLHLPGDRIRPATKTYRGGTTLSYIDATTISLMKECCRRQEATVFMGLLTAVYALLYRYTGQNDIIVGSPVAGREHPDLEAQIGSYINILALRARIAGEDGFDKLLALTKQMTVDAYDHQLYPFDELVDQLNLDRDISRNPLFEVLVVLQNAGTGQPDPSGPPVDLQASVYRSENDDDQQVFSKFDLTFSFTERGDAVQLYMEYNSDIFDKSTIEHLTHNFSRLLKIMVSQPSAPLDQLIYLGAADIHRLLVTFNDTEVRFDEEATIIELFEAQAGRTPLQTALVCQGRALNYHELNALSNRLADYLKKNYMVRTGDMIGIRLHRSEWMLITILGVLKSGGAYIPIDPDSPDERVAYVLSDSKCKVVIDSTILQVIRQTLDYQDPEDHPGLVRAADLAYCIYTSGSTGQPKGCLLTHANVVSFFAGMNEIFGKDAGTMLAVTNYTFDISVLELIWTLTLGYKVILQQNARELSGPADVTSRPLDFSLFYFGNASLPDSAGDEEKYRLLLDGAKYADRNGYTAVWTPERHFHEFGGLYPNPSVTGAALSSITRNISIRAGSVVLPLHNPLRVAEEWSVLDNLSGGRVGIACASGWHSNDFVLSSGNYQQRHELMYGLIDTIRRLWKGGSVAMKDGNGLLKETRIFPRPIQQELPMWLTSANHIETFVAAGRKGMNVLTHLLGETVEGLAVKIKAYRTSLADNGHDPDKGKVALMLHTYIGDSKEETYEKARQPFTDYLRTSASLLKNMAVGLDMDMEAATFSEQDMNTLLEHAFKRYVSSASLIGTVPECKAMIDRLQHIGVDEIACLIDFGVEYNAVMKSLELLTTIKNSYEDKTADVSTFGHSLQTQLKKHKPTHLQATPSMMTLMQQDLQFFRPLKKLILGGERLPLTLVKELYRELPEVEIYNMYGPTETTIWSTCSKVHRQADKIHIGRPIANTRIYILDGNRNLLPIGVIGELYIGGKGVARGYLQRPDLSASRFLDDPFVPGGKCYRTGDYAKWLPDGNIEYVGRRDDQVKIRGHRIELGEIEAALRSHPLVEMAAVVVKEFPGMEAELIAYIVAPEKLNTPSLRSTLGRKLPAYMIPERFVQLPSLPLTPNGKVDRRRLPDPSERSLDSGTRFEAPANEIENRIARIWQEILNRDNVSVTDNFFDAGGNSVRIVRMVMALNKVFDKKTSVATAFKFTNIRSLAAYLLTEENGQNTDTEEDTGKQVDLMEETFRLVNADTDEE